MQSNLSAKALAAFVRRAALKMRIAKALGTVVSTVKDHSLGSVKLLFVQYMDENGETLPEYEVAADLVGAGIGEWVLISIGSAARKVSGYEDRSLDAAVVGIIDTVNLGSRSLYSKKDAG
jgi:carbon dioxide concentrating mechanism protein CcmL